MKKAFTLVEMLIVVVVLVTLMAMTFRLSGISSDSWKRNVTISHLQRLENCLSGYYAAFNSYPAVKLHGTRNIYIKTDGNGLQTYGDNEQENQNIWGWDPEKFRRYIESGENVKFYQQEEADAWGQVQAACLAQPVACNFPFPKSFEHLVTQVSGLLQKKANSNESKYKQYQKNKSRFGNGFVSVSDPNVLNNLRNSEDWRDTQIFKFGLMSFLLPRYLFMLDIDDDTANVVIKKSQWTANNSQVHDPWTGELLSWKGIQEYTFKNDNTSADKKDYARVACVFSQSVCARWLPNLEETCSCNYNTTFFGTQIHCKWGNALTDDNPWMQVYSTGEGDSGAKYVLDEISVKDGWYHHLYYYSPSPHQTYTLWSAGPNGRTFPPWIDRGELGQKENRCIGAWIEDDIVNMKN